MRAIIDIFLAIIFTVALGSGSLKVINNQIKRESMTKVQKGLSSIEEFSRKLTQK